MSIVARCSTIEKFRPLVIDKSSFRLWAEYDDLSSPDEMIPFADLREISKIQIITAPHYRRETQSSAGDVVGGAIVGGFIDSLSGDDSILDGAIIGGLLGGAASRSEVLVKQPGLANIFFKDGVSLTVEVDEMGLAELLAAAESFRNQPSKSPSIGSDKVPGFMYSASNAHTKADEHRTWILLFLILFGLIFKMIGGSFLRLFPVGDGLVDDMITLSLEHRDYFVFAPMILLFIHYIKRAAGR